MDEWFLNAESGTAGPYTREQITNWLSEGAITPDRHIWRDGMEEWKLIGQVSDFSAAPPAAVRQSRALLFAGLMIAFAIAAGAWFSLRPEPAPPQSAEAAAQPAPRDTNIPITVTVAFPTAPPAVPGKTMELTALDVGQADGLLLKLPSNEYVLIDAGTSAGVLSYLRAKNIKRLKALVMTHPHADHIGGALEVLNNLEVQTVYDCGAPHTTKVYLHVLEKIEQMGVDYVQPRAGDRLMWDPYTRVMVLHPDRADYENLNNSSIVLHVTYGNIAMLLTGDAEAEAEARMVETFKDKLRAQILKTAHHGSRSSSTPEFLAAVAPEIALISCGTGNSYGHPHPRTVAALTDAGAKIYRTDEEGYITVRTDGTEIWKEAERVPYPMAEGPRTTPMTFDGEGWTDLPGDPANRVVRSADKIEMTVNRAAAFSYRMLPDADVWEVEVEIESNGPSHAGITLNGDGGSLTFNRSHDKRLWLVNHGKRESASFNAERLAIRRNGRRLELLASMKGSSEWYTIWNLTDAPIAEKNRIALNFWAQGAGGQAQVTFR